MGSKQRKRVATPAARRAKKKARARKATQADAGEVENFIRSLREHGQVHEGKGPLPAGATHVLRKKRGSSKSKPVLERKRFSYF
jgi:hypothetical protein